MTMLADVIIPGHQFGQVSEVVPGADAFVLVTLCLLAFLFGAFSMAAFILWRRGSRPTPQQLLLMEMEGEEAIPRPSPPEPVSQPWERQADWWKGDEA